MKWEYWLIAALSVIVLILLVIMLFRRNYTRERFAFFMVMVQLPLLTLIISEVLGGPSLIEFVLFSANKLFGLNIPIEKVDWSDKVLALVPYFGFNFILLRIYNNWESDIKSVRQAQEEKEQLKASVVDDLKAELKHLTKIEKLELYTGEQDQRHQRPLLNQVDTTPLAWHRNAAEILPLIGKYQIDTDEDWHPKMKCFISTYGKNKTPVCIHCIHKAPKNADYRTVIQWLQNNYPAVHHIIVMVEDGNHAEKNIQQSLFEITIYYKATLLDNLIDVSDYKRHLKKLFYKQGIMGTDITLDEIYVPLDYYEKDKEEERKALKPFIQEWLDKDTSNRHLALLGEYGQGKSVQSLRLALDLLEAEHPRIPLLITLGGMSPRTLNPLYLLGGWGAHYDFKAKALLQLHQEGRLLLIFDGFDEMDLAGDPEMLLQHFESLWQFAKSPKAKILITGRPNFFLGKEEERRALGIDRPAHPNSSYCEAIHLHKMNTQQIAQALRVTEPEIQQSILSKIAENPKGNLYDLASRPVTLFQIGCVWEPAKFHEYKDRLYSATVIKEFIQYSSGREEAKSQKRPTNPPFLTTDERHYFMQGIAVAMVNETEYSNQISPESLREIVSHLYDHIPDDLSSTSNSHQASRKPLKERTKQSHAPKESTLIDVCACGLLIKDPINGHGFKFAHKSFLEYFFSDFCAAKLLGQQENIVKVFDTLYTAKELNFSKTTFDLTTELIAEHYNTPNNTQDIAKQSLYALTNIKLGILRVYLTGAGAMAMAVAGAGAVAGAWAGAGAVAGTGAGAWAVAWAGAWAGGLYIDSNSIKKNKASTYQLIRLWYASCIKMGIPKTTLHTILPSTPLEEITNTSEFTPTKKTPQP